MSVFAHAQTAPLENKTTFTSARWTLKVGANLVDNSGDKNPFNALNVKEMGISNPIAAGFDYRFSQHWSLGLMVSNNKFLKSKSKVDGELFTEDLTYFATDLNIKYAFWRAQFEAEKNFNLYVLGGFGTSKIIKSTLNYQTGIGMVFWLNDVVGIHAESVAKWASKNTKYDSNHFQHFVGLSFRFQGNKDSDNDGVADNDDACPTVFGLVALQGCPDSDGDGVVDAKDACKNSYGPKENKGCPYEDTDQDGILDPLDKCPKVFGLLAENGCPAKTTIAETETEADKIATEKQAIKKFLKNYSKAIYFQPSKTTFSAEGGAMLKDIAAFLKQFPSAQILVEGHADSIGSYEFNHKIAKERANIIKAFLIKNGIPSTNIEAVSYGERKSVATNMFKAGRALNRRVRIKVKE